MTINDTFINRHCRYCDCLQIRGSWLDKAFPYDSETANYTLNCTYLNGRVSQFKTEIKDMNRCPRL